MAGVTGERSRIAVASFIFFCLALTLSAWSARNPNVSGVGVLIVSEATRPLELLLEGSSAAIKGAWDNYIALIGLRAEHEKLNSRYRALEVENSRFRESEVEIRRLRSLLGIAEEKGFIGVAADVIGFDPTNWTQVITVDRGASDGIQKGMPAIQGDAVVGQVVAVSPNSSKVLLLTDHSSGVDAIAQETRARGMVEGDGRNLCRMRYVSQEDQISVGDRILTSGMDQIFPKGLLIGVVAETARRGRGMFQGIIIKPAVDFSRLETVLIIKGEEKKNAPVPTPSPAATPLKNNQGKQ